LFKEVIDIITIFPEFREYIEKTWYNNEYDNAYVIFWELIRYIENCYNEWYNFEIEQILMYLWEKIKTDDEVVKSLIQFWFLENLDHYKFMLPNLVDMMPKNLKELFLEYYSDYLD
jgi:hypothetical protein